MRRLKLYVDPELLSRGGSPTLMVAPLLHPELSQRTATESRWARYAQLAPSLYELSSLADCDYSVLPYPWPFGDEEGELMRGARQAAAAGSEAGKKLLVFSHMDPSSPINVQGSLVYRTSMERSTRQPNELAQPAWADDLLARFNDGRLALRQKQAKPVVGFCGYAPPNGIPLGRQWVKERTRMIVHKAGIARPLGISTGLGVRSRAINRLESSNEVDTNFLFRDHEYRDDAGNVGPWHSSLAYRSAYVANTLSSDYVLCTRGWGNFSFRLYEALCLGRIPVFVDSDCVLPADDVIDWKALCVWVDERNLADLPQQIRAHHDQLSAEEFVARQRLSRETWERYLSPEGFFRYLHGQLSAALESREELPPSLATEL